MTTETAESTNSIVNILPGDKCCTFEGGCTKKAYALGLCTGHYRQQHRGAKLTPLRQMRGLVLLPLVIRVQAKTKAALEARIASGKAVSMYDATRQALEAGVTGWEKEAAIATLTEQGSTSTCGVCGSTIIHSH